MTNETMPITVTEQAANYILQMAKNLASEPNLSLKVLPGGCSGMKYAMEFVAADDVRKSDIVMVLDGGAKVYIDKDSVEFLTGATITINDDLMAPGLKIDNPNAQRQCGCGKSFG